MRIGRLEIRWIGGYQPSTINHQPAPSDLPSALAVSDREPLWLAVHAIINQAERESLDGARLQVANERSCINSLGMADGAALVRSKLVALRDEALRRSDVGGRRSE